MIAPTVHLDLVAVWNLAIGLGLLAFVTEQRQGLRRWVLSFLGVVLVWSGVLETLR